MLNTGEAKVYTFVIKSLAFQTIAYGYTTLYLRSYLNFRHTINTILAGFTCLF
jgi:hypothetical protein